VLILFKTSAVLGGGLGAHQDYVPLTENLHSLEKKVYSKGNRGEISLTLPQGQCYSSIPSN
jgi:hypothetical protein